MGRRSLTVVVCLAVLGVALPAAGQGTSGEFAASFTSATSELEAFGNVSYEPSGFLMEGSWFFNERLGLTAELGFAAGSNVRLTVDTTTALGGVRFRFPNDSFVTPSVRVAAGLGHISVEDLFFGDTDSASDLAIVFGGSIDFYVTEHLAIRVQPDVIWYNQYDPVMFRFGFGLSYAFGREFGQSAAAQPAPPRATPAQPGQAAPARAAAPSIATLPVTRIEAGDIPAGSAPPRKVTESAGWTALTDSGVGYAWSVTVQNNDLVAHTVSVTARLYDAAGNALKVDSSELLPVQPGETIVISNTSEVSRQMAQQGDYWTISAVWVDRE